MDEGGGERMEMEIEGFDESELSMEATEKECMGFRDTREKRRKKKGCCQQVFPLR